MDNRTLPQLDRLDHLEPINRYADSKDAQANRAIKNTSTTIEQLAISQQTLSAAVEALEIARQQLGVAEISNSEGTITYTSAGLSVDSFNTEMRACAVTKREGKRYMTKGTGS